MTLYEDLGNKANKHTIKNKWWLENEINVVRVPLPVGDYIVSNEKVEDVISRKAKRGVPLKKMDFLGSYNVAVDTKENLQEIIGNVCGKQHERFRDECILAQNNGIKLIILIENEDGINKVSDLFSWRNPRLDIMVRDASRIIGTYRNGMPRYGRKQKYPKATKGTTLAKALLSMEKKYGVKFEFTTPYFSGKRVLELLKESE